MNIGGLGMIAALARGIKPSKRCRRCGLSYPLKAEQCPHCSDLDEAGLAELKVHIEQQHRANAGLGKLFLYIMGLILVGLVIVLISPSM